MTNTEHHIDPSTLSDEELLSKCIDTLLALPDSTVKNFEMTSFYTGCVQGQPWKEKIWFNKTGPELAQLTIHITKKQNPPR